MSLFVDALRGRPTDRTPVWFMRQAGRALPEYRALRAEHTMHEVVTTPELAAAVTLQPVRRYGVDAAVIYSDIVTPLAAMGVDVEIVEGVGPVFAHPVRDREGLARLRPFVPEVDAPYVADTVRLVAAATDVPVIGFAGAPFTLASYVVEGRPTRQFAVVKAMMHTDTDLFRSLLDHLAAVSVASLRAQVDAGAAAVQIFDSWAGCLSRDEYERFVLPVTRRMIDDLADLAVPRILFGVGTPHLLELMGSSGTDALSVDWRLPIRTARELGGGPAIQGNLDPAVLSAPWDVVRDRADAVLASNDGHPAYVFNLGHGVLPDTPFETLQRLVEHVGSRAAR